MKTKAYLTEQDAEQVLQLAVDYAKQKNWNVSIALVDDSGCLLAMKRLDGAAPMTANLAVEKARCSALSRIPSKILEELIQKGQIGFVTMQSFSGMLEGGEPILYQGQVIGAFGVSGVKSYEDAEIAQVAIAQFLAAQD